MIDVNKYRYGLDVVWYSPPSPVGNRMHVQGQGETGAYWTHTSD